MFSTQVTKSIQSFLILPFIVFLIFLAVSCSVDIPVGEESVSPFSPDPLNITVVVSQGQTVKSDPITLKDDEGLCTDIRRYEITNIPPGLIIVRDSSNITSGCDSLKLSVTADINAPVGQYAFLAVTLNKGLGSQSTARITFVVQPATGIEVTISAGISVRVGSSAGTLVNIGRFNVSDAINLSVDGLPAGLTATFNPNPLPGTQSTLTIDADASTAAGNYPVKIIGSTNSGYADTLETTIEVLPALSTNWTLVSQIPQSPLDPIEDIDFTYNTLGVIVGGGRPYYSNDGGQTWNQGNISNVATVYYAVDGHDSTFYAVGIEDAFNNIIFSENAGLSWSSAGAVEFTSYYDVSVTNNNVYVVGSTLQTTNNFARKIGAGQWEALNAGTPNSLRGVHFYNDSTGVAVGDNGTIVKTTDYGDNWSTKSSGVSSNLQDVYFLSENEGYAIGSNGVILYTNTAGESWVQRNSGTTAQLNKIHAANNNVLTIVGQISSTLPTSYIILRTENGGTSWTEEINGSGLTSEDQLKGIYMFNTTEAIAVGWKGSIWKRQ